VEIRAGLGEEGERVIQDRDKKWRGLAKTNTTPETEQDWSPSTYDGRVSTPLVFNMW